MSTRIDPSRTTTRLPAPEEEREVDLGRYWRTLSMHWWLPAAGLAAGIVIGYLISLGGAQVYKAKATVYLGQPLSQGGVQVQSQNTNPSTVRQIVTSELTIQAVARKVGLPPGQLRGHISTQAVTGNISRLGQNPLVAIIVTGRLRGKVARAANELAAAVVSSDALAGYTNEKIKNLQLEVDTEKSALAALDRNIRAQQDALKGASGISTTDRLILASQLNGFVQQRLTTVDQLTTNQQQLALAQKVEAPQITTGAAATKTTARSRRNTVLVSALIGLLLGIAAALVYDPVMRAVRRST
jgi:succinate dehydrogenase/fumarate reductase flavoprotein subunit